MSPCTMEREKGRRGESWSTAGEQTVSLLRSSCHANCRGNFIALVVPPRGSSANEVGSREISLQCVYRIQGGNSMAVNLFGSKVFVKGSVRVLF